MTRPGSTGRWGPGLFLALTLAASGCAFGPKALERSHLRYNEAVKQVDDEQLLLNLVRLRYNEDLVQLDVSSIATQYELSGGAEARPFFIAPNPSNSNVIFRTFTSILPDVMVSGTSRPTISLTPLTDAETVRPLFVPSTLDGIIFLAETSWPVSTVFRLWVEYMNLVPNAVTASGPARPVVPEFRTFQRATQLLQALHDAGVLRFIRQEKIRELGSPLPAETVTSAALIEAAKNEFEYRQRPDKTWVLVKRDRRLELQIDPTVTHCPEVVELRELLHLQPGLNQYEVTVGDSGGYTFTRDGPPQPLPRINIYPRSTVQALFYMSNGVMVPLEHLNCGIVRPAVEPDGRVFDWQEVTAGLFTVHAVKQHCRPKGAHVAVKYRDYWFYIDERDADSKTTFALMMTMTRVNLLGTRKGVPALTLPVGR